MKRALSVLLAIIILSCTAYADNSEIKTVLDAKSPMGGLYDFFHTASDDCTPHYSHDLSVDYCIGMLNEFGILTDEEAISLYSSNGGITRREILSVLYPIKKPHLYSSLLAQTKEEAVAILENLSSCPFWDTLEFFGTTQLFNFEDIPYESEDFLFTFNAYSASLIRGIEIDGYSYALLDKECTYGEAISMICRLFLTVPYFNETDLISLMQEIGYTDNYMYYFAEKINLINSDNLFDISAPEITLEQWNSPIPKTHFYWLLYRALYVPVFGTFDLGMPYYYINDYVLSK